MASSTTYFVGGELPRMLEAGRLGLRAAEESGDQLYVYLALGWQMWAQGPEPTGAA